MYVCGITTNRTNAKECQFRPSEEPNTTVSIRTWGTMAANGGATTLASFQDAEPDTSSFPLKVGSAYYPPGTCFHNGDEIFRLIYTTMCNVDDGGIQHACMNVLVKRSTVPGAQATTANQSKDMPQYVQTLQTKVLGPNAIHNLSLHFLFSVPRSPSSRPPRPSAGTTSTAPRRPRSSPRRRPTSAPPSWPTPRPSRSWPRTTAM